MSQRAADLAASLAKDVPAAAAPLVVKVLSDGSKLAASTQITFTYAAIAYLIVSLVLQTVVSGRFVVELRRARWRWLTALDGALPEDELLELADQPLARAETTFWIVYFVVVATYFLMAFGLWAAAGADDLP